MMDWFAQLKPEMQLLLISQVIAGVFIAGGYFVTIKNLATRVGNHDEIIVKHTAKLAVLDERTKEL